MRTGVTLTPSGGRVKGLCNHLFDMFDSIINNIIGGYNIPIAKVITVIIHKNLIIFY